MGSFHPIGSQESKEGFFFEKKNQKTFATLWGSMRQALHRMYVDTRGKSLINITALVGDWVGLQQMSTGLLTLWCAHTSASLTVQENASPAVLADVLRFFDAAVPEDPDRYAHADEGPDDMPAHLRTMLTSTHLSIPVADGQPTLGQWQAIYLFEHRRHRQRREIILHLLGA